MGTPGDTETKKENLFPMSPNVNTHDGVNNSSALEHRLSGNVFLFLLVRFSLGIEPFTGVRSLTAVQRCPRLWSSESVAFSFA